MIKELLLYLWESMPLFIASFVGTLGFAIVFKVKWKYLIPISVCGFFTYVIYLSAIFLGCSEFLAALLTSAFVGIVAEALARIMKAPTIIFSATGIVSIVPGSFLYYSMRSLLLRDMDGFVYNFKNACLIAAGIVLGIVSISVVIKLLMSLLISFKKEK